MKLLIPKDYDPLLDIRHTEVAIKKVKDFFERDLATQLNLTRVSAPLFVKTGTGLNDNLNGVERPVGFDVLETGDEVEIVHSLAKWKRFFERENVHPNIEPTVVDDPTVIYMVEHGMGISILSELVMHGNKNDVISLPITPAAHRELVICLKSLKAASENTKIFIECAQQIVKELYHEQ